MKVSIKAVAAAFTLAIGAVQAAPVARVILNSDPGEFVGHGGFYDMTIDPVVDQAYLSVYPNTYVPPMSGFLFTFGDSATDKWGSLSLYGMNAGSTSEYGSLSFWGSGCNQTVFSSHTHESVVSGFSMTRFVASFTQSCNDSFRDTDTKISGIFIYDTAGELGVPAYLANSPVLTPAVPEPGALGLAIAGMAGLGLFLSRRHRRV